MRAGIEHLGLLAPLFGAYRQFYGESADEAAEHRFIKARLNNAESVVFLAVDKADGSQACGFVQLYPGFDSVVLSSIWTLHDLYVAAEHRSSGVGRQLMNAAHEFCRGAGGARVDLCTAVTNSTAKSLYASMGYEVDEEFEHYSLDPKI